MKKLAILVLFGAFATAASAQFLLGGQFNASVVKDKQVGTGDDFESTTTLVTLIPRLAFASGNMWYGLDAGVNLIKDKSDLSGGSTETKTTIATIAPFFRSIKRFDNLGIWIEAQAGASFGSAKDNDGNKTDKYTGFNVGLRPGVILFIGDHLSFEASFGRLGYTSFTDEDPNDSSNKETVSQAGLMLNSNTILLDQNTLGATTGFLFGANWLF